MKKAPGEIPSFQIKLTVGRHIHMKVRTSVSKCYLLWVTFITSSAMRLCEIY